VLYVRCKKSLLEAIDRYRKRHERKHGISVTRSSAARALIEKQLTQDDEK
jgi:hypothetical protein